VLVDFDDTLVCSGGAPAGVDDCKSDGLRPGGFYPGAIEFVTALALGTSGSGGEVIPTSARPKVLRPFLGISESGRVAARFREVYLNMTGCRGTVLRLDRALYGNLGDFFHRERNRNYRMGATKVRNVVGSDIHGRLGGRCLSFVGDNGQGDVMLAKVLSGPDTNVNFFDRGAPKTAVQLSPGRLNTLRDHTCVAWIHDVKRDGLAEDGTKGGRVRELYGPPLYGLPYGRLVYFRDYGAAAHVAWEKGLITEENKELIQNLTRRPQRRN